MATRVARRRTRKVSPTSNGAGTVEVGLSLASEVSEPVADLAEFSILIFGRPKIGKTTLTSCFPDCHHFMTEKGAKTLKIHQRFVSTWEEMEDYLDLVEDSKFKTVTIDVVDRLYEMCVRHVLDKMDLDEIPEDYGKTYGKIRREFMRVIYKAQALNQGCLFLGHAATSDRTTADGDKVSDTHPNFSGKMLEEFIGSLDMVAYYTYKRGHRVLQIEGDDFVFAGHRLSDHFRTTDGQPIKFVPMGNSPQESYDNLLRAFMCETKPEELDHLSRKTRKTED